MTADLFSDAVAEGRMEAPVRVPYRVPTMDEVRALPWNGLTSVSTFSGCGGSGLGFRMAGFRVPVAVEFIPAAADSYEANSDATVVRKDVRQLDGAALAAIAGFEPGELDVLEGSPPCASFSAAGSGQKDWGRTKKYSDGEQRTDDLFFEYVRLIREAEPRAFVAENVPGLIRGAAVEEYAWKVTKLMSELGYRVDARVLNAANFGVPQERERLIFIGFRRDLNIQPTFPTPTVSEPYTVRDALATVVEDRPEDVASSSMEPYAVGRTWKKIVEYRAAHGTEPDFTRLPCQRCAEPLDQHQDLVATSSGAITKARCADGAKAEILKDYFMMTVPWLDRPCPTVTATGAQAGAASVTHPTECRKMTPAELRAICGFPADFILTGTREQRAERMGRAVPPPLYAAVSGHVAKLLVNASDAKDRPDA